MIARSAYDSAAAVNVTKRSWVLLLCCLLLAGGEARSGNDLTEREKLEGTWSFIRPPQKEEKKEARGAVKMVFKGETISFVADDEKRTVRGTYKVDPSKNPRTMDITIDKDNGEKGVTLAIYEVDGESLKICHYLGAKAGKERPKEFLADKQTVLGVLKREKKSTGRRNVRAWARFSF